MKCIDLGGNADSKEFSYEVEVDYTKPTIVRAYKEGSDLKIITNEEAGCVYSNNDCNYLFDDGLAMSVIDKKNHYIGWNSEKAYYIKCQDKYTNQPLPNECSIIVRPTEEYEITG